MRDFFNFLIKYNYWLLFFLLEAISFVLIFRFNNYQGSVYFTSANHVSGTCAEFFGNINSYFGLRTQNELLVKENISLRQQLNRFLQEEEKKMSDSSIDTLLPDRYHLIAAEVINNSLNKKKNWITLNRGRTDGILPEMGIFNSEGVIGIVYLVSTHYSLVIPILNTQSSISCKLKNSDCFCSLTWPGGDVRIAYLNDLPRHAVLSAGDTVVTSGYSTIFPKGLPVGRVVEIKDSPDALFYQAKVELSVDFSRLKNVYAIGDDQAGERKVLEKQTTEK